MTSHVLMLGKFMNIHIIALSNYFSFLGERISEVLLS